jgi:chromate reductase
VSDLTRLPFYDADVEAAGTPEPVSELRTAVRAADLLVLVTPEYNGSVPGLLANAIDWLSRPHRDAALRGTSVLVLSASPRPSGGARAAAQLRAVLTGIGASVLPTGLSVGAAHSRLSDEIDRQLVADLTGLLTDALEPAAQGAA